MLDISKDAKVFLSPGVLLVKGPNGETKAQTGDVITSVGVLSPEQYTAAGGDYDALWKLSMVEAIVAKRRDDGNTAELTEEEKAAEEAKLDEVLAAKKAAAEDKVARQEAALTKPIVVADSNNAPPTASPLTQGSVVPNPDLPLPPATPPEPPVQNGGTDGGTTQAAPTTPPPTPTNPFGNPA